MDEIKVKLKPLKISEDMIHRQVIQWARLQRLFDGRVSDYLHHSPNGGKRDAREGAKFKAQGVLAGFPDLFLFVPVVPYSGLFIELKAKKGIVSDSQKVIMSRLAMRGYSVKVAYGFDEAIKIIQDYLSK